MEDIQWQALPLAVSLNRGYICNLHFCLWWQQTKAKYEIEAEKRELARLLEKRTQEVENLSGKISGSHTSTETAHNLVSLYVDAVLCFHKYMCLFFLGILLHCLQLVICFHGRVIWSIQSSGGLQMAYHSIHFSGLVLWILCGHVCLFAEDVKRLNEKLTETSKVKMELQLKLDDIQSTEASVQVHSRYTWEPLQSSLEAHVGFY